MLHDYQKEALDKILCGGKTTVTQIPTGGGKTPLSHEYVLKLQDGAGYCTAESNQDYKVGDTVVGNDGKNYTIDFKFR